jgi:hypothetical protein
LGTIALNPAAMVKLMQKWALFLGAVGATLAVSQFIHHQSERHPNRVQSVSHAEKTCQKSASQKNAFAFQKNASQTFGVFGGGGAASYNEIALEKNVLYFQRTLKKMGFSIPPIFFANGTTGEKTVRYIDADREKFKSPNIPNLQGASTYDNLRPWMREAGKQSSPIFFYFTGHGVLNESNHNNNQLMLWKNEALSVQDFTQLLDQLPQNLPFVTMMSQCYSGSFANLIYKAGDPNRGVALQTRCGFFATIKTQPSVGCTPEVNEADYRDYSSSFFAGLSGRDRTGKSVASADYNKDGRVSYAEAHAFAKVDEQTTDLPISTSEAWLQEQVTNRTLREKLLTQPIAPLAKIARPEQRYVINAISQKYGFDLGRSLTGNVKSLKEGTVKSQEDQAFITRLSMELINVAMEYRVKSSKDQSAIATLNRLLKCESGNWAIAKAATQANAKPRNAIQPKQSKAK